MKKEEEVALDIELVMQVKMFNLSNHGELGMLNFLESLKLFFSEIKIWWGKWYFFVVAFMVSTIYL